MLHTKAGLVTVMGAAVFALAACDSGQMTQTCAPGDAPMALTASSEEATGPITAYWDGSESLAGYIDGANANLHPLADIQRLINDHARDGGFEISWKRFGSKITALPANGDPSTVAFYRCGRSADCDNQESRLDEVLNKIADDRSPGLRIIVSDLWLSTSAFRGSTEVAIGGPLRRILAGADGKDQRSIGVIGIRAPYSGPVYEVPNVGTHRGARERPLFVLLVGTRKEVLTGYRSLTRAGSPAFAENRIYFSWFGPDPANDWMGDLPQAELRGSAIPATILSEPERPIRQIEVSLKDLQSNKASVRVSVDPTARLLPGAVWEGQPNGFTRVWRRKSKGCGSGAWEAMPDLQGAWRSNKDAEGKINATFTLDRSAAEGLLPGHTYLVTASYTTKTITRNSDATRWMRDWSVSPEQSAGVSARNPAFFPALNLAELAVILEQGTQDQQPKGGRPLATVGLILNTKP